MSLTLAPTGSSIGDYENLAAFEVDTSFNRTPITSVPNPGLREVLIRFIEALREPLAPLRGFVRRTTAVQPTPAKPSDTAGGEWSHWHVSLMLGDHVPMRVVTLLESAQTWDGTPLLKLYGAQLIPAAGTDDAVATIDEMAKRVGLPVKDILAAAGVKKSTYHSWKALGAPTPRLASQGRLWEVAQFIEDFTELLGGPIRPWLHSDERRRSLFATGHFAELHELLRSQPRPRITAPEYASLVAIGGDRLVSDTETEPPRKPLGRSGPVQRVKAADRSRVSNR